MLQLKNIPQCDSKVTVFNHDLWPGMLTRMKQLLITNNSEHIINWTLKDPSRIVKSIANLVVSRGDKIYEEKPTAEAEVFTKNLYSKAMPPVLTTVRDSHRLFGHEKSVGLLSNNQSHCAALDRTLSKATLMR